MMALAMLPPPMKAMWCEVVMSGVPCVSDADGQSGNCRCLWGVLCANLAHMDYMLSIDQGTTSSRAVVFDRAGQVVAMAQREFTQHFPRPGWVEHDASEIWQTQLAVLREVLGQAGITAQQIRAMGITNQRETTVLWDRQTGQPVAPAIVWQDRRTAGFCEDLRAAGHAAVIAAKTGLVLDAYFSGTKLAWLLDHVPGARARAERGELAFGTVDSWLLWQLTGGRVHATEPSNASRTLLFNLKTGTWDDDMLALLNIPPAVLPRILPSCGQLAETDAHLLGASVPIAGWAGDQQAALFGQACFAPGMAKNTYGTGCFMLMNTGDQPVASHHQLLSTVAWQGPGAAHRPMAYALEGSVFMAGATVQWLRDGLQIIDSAAQVEALAASVQDTGDVFLVPAFAGLGTPDWDGQARGTLVGMTRGTGRAHIARAALEAIALQTADVFRAMSADSGLALTELRVDGGASKNDLLMQIQANVLGVPVVRSRISETTALGVAYLAGLATGYWSDAEELSAQWQEERRFLPQWPESKRTAHVARWREAVMRSRAWAQC
jgi:glycerol kinase